MKKCGLRKIYEKNLKSGLRHDLIYQNRYLYIISKYHWVSSDIYISI